MTTPRLAKVAIAAALAPVVVTISVAVGASGAGVLQPVAAGCVTIISPSGAPGPGSDSLDADQLGNVRIIATVAVQLGLPPRAAIIAVATAMQESRLRNLTAAVDHDSIGLFQQRPSQGWGSPDQLTDPVYASTAFYRHLVAVPGWQTMPLTDAAQAVQHSAYLDAYAQWEPLATRLVAATIGICTGIPGDTTTLPPGFTLPPDTPGPVIAAIAWALGQLGTPYSFGGSCTDSHSGNPALQCDCSSLVQQAYQAAGIALPRTTYEQVHTGLPVDSPSQMRAGDLVFTPGSDGTADNPGHVGIYLGNGLVLHAPQTGDVVKISNLQGYWLDDLVAIRRVVE